MGFFKKIFKAHDKVFHPVENYFKKKGGSDNFSGLMKGIGITPKDAPETVQGSTFQRHPGFDPSTGLFAQQGQAPGGTVSNLNTGGRVYAPNPFNQQMATANAVRTGGAPTPPPSAPGGGAPPSGPQQMPGMASNPMGSFQAQNGLSPQQIQQMQQQMQGQRSMMF